MSNLVGILTAGSAAVGLAAGAGQAAFAARRYLAAQKEVRRLAQDEERLALGSDDIGQLGGYLYNNIGDTQIANYVENAEVRARVTRALDSILSFLGTEDTEITTEDSEIVSQEERSPNAVRALEEFRPYIDASASEMAKAFEEIAFGEVWNGLARMRRHIEFRLQEFSPELARGGRRQTIGRLLSLLSQSGQIPDNGEKLLRYAINVANAGIHGNDVAAEQALEAWQAAVRGLALLPTPAS